MLVGEGGGGWGDPYDRDAELVAADVARGLVSAEGAKRYGVVIADDGSVGEGKGASCNFLAI